MVELAGVYAVLAAMETVMVVGGTGSRDSTSALPALLVIFQFHQHGWGLIVDEPTLLSIPMRFGAGSLSPRWPVRLDPARQTHCIRYAFAFRSLFADKNQDQDKYQERPGGQDAFGK